MALKNVAELNHYEVLDVPRNFRPDELEQAYVRCQTAYAPESMAGYGLLSEGQRQRLLEQIQAAYHTLSIRSRRTLYDQEVFKGAARFSAAGLIKSYGHRTVVQDVGVEVHSGEIIGLLGRNGAGKTTLMQMLVGLVKPDSGEIFLDGETISRDSTNRRAIRGIIYLVQESSIFLKASVWDNLRLILELQPYSRAERKALARDLLDKLGLLPLANQKAHSLSGGERRKLEICRMLCLKPKFILLDEPFTGIDPMTIAELRKIILDLKANGIGIVLSDHNVRDTFRITSRVYIIDEGKVLVEGPPARVANNKNARERFLGKDFRYSGEINP
jgi:lipopolysaccharide export system ATP-binding protein